VRRQPSSRPTRPTESLQRFARAVLLPAQSLRVPPTFLVGGANTAPVDGLPPCTRLFGSCGGGVFHRPSPTQRRVQRIGGALLVSMQVGMLPQVLFRKKTLPPLSRDALLRPSIKQIPKCIVLGVGLHEAAIKLPDGRPFL
jgi:hypothetical protein